jgi:pseudouridine-5'-monophosphatase
VWYCGVADTEGFYTEVQEKILARYGKVFDWSLKAKMMGKKAAESARIFVDECGLDGLLTPEQFLEERESMLQALFPSCTKMPGERMMTPISTFWHNRFNTHYCRK